MDMLTKQWGNEPAVPAKLDLGATLNMPQEEYEHLMEMVGKLNQYEKTGRTPEELCADLARLAEYDRQIADGELVKVVRGEWIFQPVSGEDPYACSVCGNTVNVHGFEICPYCGASMKGANHEND